QAEDGIRDKLVTGVQTCALPISIARGAEGGMRDAESMLDQLVAFCGEKIEEADVLNVFGFTSQQMVADFVGRILRGETADALARSEERSVGKEWNSRWWT